MVPAGKQDANRSTCREVKLVLWRTANVAEISLYKHRGMLKG